MFCRPSPALPACYEQRRHVDPAIRNNRFVALPLEVISDYIIPWLPLQDCEVLRRTNKFFYSVSEACAGKPCPNPLYVKIVMVFQHVVSLKYSITLRSFAEGYYPKGSNGWMRQEIRNMALYFERSGGNQSFSKRWRETGDLTCTTLTCLREHIEKMLYEREESSKFSNEEVSCVLEFIGAWIDRYPYDREIFYAEHFIYRFLNHIYRRTLMAPDEIWSKMLQLTRQYLTEGQQQRFLYYLANDYLSRFSYIPFQLIDLLIEYPAPGFSSLIFRNFTLFLRSYMNEAHDEIMSEEEKKFVDALSIPENREGYELRRHITSDIEYIPLNSVQRTFPNQRDFAQFFLRTLVESRNYSLPCKKLCRIHRCFMRALNTSARHLIYVALLEECAPEEILSYFAFGYLCYMQLPSSYWEGFFDMIVDKDGEMFQSWRPYIEAMEEDKSALYRYGFAVYDVLQKTLFLAKKGRQESVSAR